MIVVIKKDDEVIETLTKVKEIEQTENGSLLISYVNDMRWEKKLIPENEFDLVSMIKE